jgi:pyruvate formate lyase activating enzyme
VNAVFVSAGYVSPGAREEIFAHMDAANIDLKAFTEDFYRKVTLSHLGPVLETLAWLAKNRRTWTEVTTLLIPGLNDGDAEVRALAEWIGANMGPDTPLHFTAFHPDFKLLDRPPTPPRTLLRARALAREAGLRHVYTGNVHDPASQTTFCPGCGAKVIERDWHAVLAMRLDGDRCAACGERIAGRFSVSRTANGYRRVLGLP